MVKIFHLHTMHKQGVRYVMPLTIHELFLKKRELVNEYTVSMLKLDTEVMKVRLVALRLAF